MRRIVLRAARALRRGASRERAQLRWQNDFYAAEQRFFEASDTMPRDALIEQLDRWLRAAGFRRIEAYVPELAC